MAMITGTEPDPNSFKLFMHELDKDGSGSVTLEQFIETMEEVDDDGGAEEEADDDDDDIDQYGNEFGTDPREQLLQALDD